MRRLFFPSLFLLFLGLCPVLASAAPQFLDDDAENACDVSFSLQTTPTGQATFYFDFQDAKNGYVLAANARTVSFSSLKNGQKQLLSSAPVAWKTQNSVVLQRRPWVMRLLVNGRVVLTAFDGTYNAGKLGFEATGWALKETRVQPVEAIRFDDDFTRAGSEGDNSWTVASGKWQLSTSSQHVNARNATMSSNPFAYEVNSPAGMALTTVGRPFWDSYDARVAVRPNSAGNIGIAAYVQDPKNYLAFVWGGKESPTARRLIRVQNGVTTTLASASGAFLPRQWYEIGLRTSPGTVEALLDGVPVLRTQDESFGRGGIGLMAQNMDASFDDVRVRSYDFYRQDLAATNGVWTTQGDFRLTGRNNWNIYRLITPLKAGATVFGVVTGFQDAKNYTLWRAASATSGVPFHGRTQLIRVQNGVSKTLSDAPLTLDLKRDARLTLDVQNDALTISNGSSILAQAAAPSLTTGQSGVWKPAAFGGETVLYFPPVADAPKIADRMEDDAYMVGWASPTGEWPPTTGDSGLEFWNTGEFFGDASLEFPWRDTYKGTFEVALRATRGQFASGYVLRGTSSDDRKNVTWTLLRGDKTLGSAQIAVPPPAGDDLNSLTFKVVLQDQSILLFADSKPILSVLDTTHPAGNAIAVRSTGFRVRAERLHAVSANRDDYTFSGAPTDFYAPQGHWSIFSRWPCYGDWSFFGGQGFNPVLWSKRSYGGDIVAEMYAHPQMILPKEPGYTHPGDLNITLCGDGKNLASGYSFVVAGWDNTRSRLLKGTQVLAENTGDEAFFHDTINHNMKWHRKWFYIRAEARRAQKDGKNGVQLTLTLDDAPILTAFDPNPLPNWKENGRVALWTVDSTLMVARAKIEAEKLGTKSLPSGLLDATPTKSALPNTPQPVVMDDAMSALVVPDKVGWTIKDPASGGAFEVQLDTAPREVTPQAHLELDAAIPAGVKVDAYCFIEGMRYLIEMTGGQKPDAMAPSLGKMTQVGTKWSFDLGAALQKRFPDQKSWNIEGLSLGARHGDEYRWLGFDGNTLGSSYKLTSWSLK